MTDAREETTMWRFRGVALVILIAAAVYGCAQQSASAPAVRDKTYVVTPATVSVQAGVVAGALTEMKVTERVEDGSGRVVTPAKLTGSLKLKNTSATESVRLVGGRIFYLDAQGQRMALEDARVAPTLKLDGYGSERLDPGQEASQPVDVEFPAAALKVATLKEIRLELSYIPSPFKAEAVNFAVTIAEPK
jgi:glucose/arabinose dehydrogenase